MLGRRRTGLLAAGGFATLLALAAWFSLAIVSPSFALKTGGPSDFSLGGNATVVQPGNGSTTAAELSATGDSESHANLAIPDGLKLRQLTSLSTDYKFVAGSCWAGSPRFTANVKSGTKTGSVFFYIGPSPGYTGCAQGSYANSGNLATPTGLVDARSLPGGSFDEPYSKVQTDFGDYTVTAVHLDVDGGTTGAQTVDFDNTVVNGRLVTYEAEHGISFLVERTAGSVQVKEPGKRGKRGFRRFKKVENVRVNSLIDTRGGRIAITAATGDFADTTPDNTMSFYDGLIRLQQKGAHDARAIAKLAGKLNCPKGGKAATASKASEPIATTSRKRKRRVWGSGSGNYSTSGSGGTGSVRGTTWLTKDTCRGTFFKVTTGLGITVFDLGRKERVDLGPGQSYFARNR